MTAKRVWTAIAALGTTLTLGACSLFPPKIPDYPAPNASIWLYQGWSEAQQRIYHRADQGTLTFGIPYEWFAALEQPNLLAEAPLLRDKSYLDRFGFIPGTGELPVGFAVGAVYRDPAKGTAWTNPATGQPLHGIGLTCAACHTGRLTYKGTELLIEGGSAMADLGAYRTSLGLAMLYTKLNPFRFDRFAARVLGEGASAQAKEALKTQLNDTLAAGKKEVDLTAKHKAINVDEGFARLDAINRIGNQVFSVDMNLDENYAAITAPVHFPHIWTAPWFTWVQYNGSIMQPMVRNAGESLGVRALANFTDPSRPLFDSTVQIGNLHWIETTLAGQPPHPARKFTGLSAPKWPSIFPAADPKSPAFARGAALYKEMCQGCHLPPPGTPEFWGHKRWVQIGGKGERYLDLVQVPIAEIGTDPEQARGMAQRTVVSPSALGLKSNSFGPALGELVERVAGVWYKTNNIPPTQQAIMNGGRPNLLQVPMEYKARTLDGIWAVAPYLHNGSVPTLFALLSPREERPRIVNLGTREYDPVDVGYRNVEITGGFALDTTKPGNSNAGHEFRDAPRGGGVIGRALSVEERRALIEFLKTL